MIKAVIFDCFGVLIGDVLRTQVEAVERLDPPRGRMLRDAMRAADRGMLTRDEYFDRLAELFAVTRHALEASFEKGFVKNEELIAFIPSLRPSFKVALLSNVRARARLDELFGEGELDRLFDTVIASGDVGIIKPERAIYELTAEQLGVQPDECVMVDDVEQYCEGAEVVGMTAIRFTSTDRFLKDFEALTP